ncbi:rod shape-determining protein MreD [Chitinibacter bivalviorum]|uniref:Rod shape-determining protein MreD n=1 Tax=Chitinibacter bivalviorum TaxID=2739434 RepID=A0A7H9BJE3_9NEIS|nr:rod shape-determining protein MreD [Chitinibacter bivalviorum]QLG88785.1 rod shape-determining protein MreD [Chitinibacter bivalviorum]
MPISRQMLRPVGGGFIFMSFIFALLINLLPWQATTASFAPDFVALMIIYWTLNQPRRFGVAWAFLLGIFMDVADGNLLGQHALAYSIIAFLTLSRQRQLAVFPFWQQAFVALAFMLLSQTIMLVVRMMMGANFVGWSYFAGSFLAAFIWPPLSNLMIMYQRKDVPDEL